jgi:hypothetical protein
MHIIAFGPVLVVPSAQGVQPRSVVSVGGAVTNCPLGQSVHGVHALALTVAVKPVTHGAHALSVVEPPIMERKEPGEQTLYVVHMAASSMVLKVPLGQGLHIGRVAVPPCTTNDPASQAQVLSCRGVPGAV